MLYLRESPPPAPRKSYVFLLTKRSARSLITRNIDYVRVTRLQTLLNYEWLRVMRILTLIYVSSVNCVGPGTR